ncbi:hypothetical protein [Nitrincola sp.]|uniref:hypothetical protein n=1 Tax=Nitrincola sp. TaxID=1926584 RepID=UPI003A951607
MKNNNDILEQLAKEIDDTAEQKPVKSRLSIHFREVIGELTESNISQEELMAEIAKLKQTITEQEAEIEHLKQTRSL